MKRSGAELVVKGLEDEGIRFAFGIPGTHNIELYDALARSDRVRPILVTDEQSAPFMADGAWRASGTMACVNLVPGAGLTHALSGIAEAFMDNVPMLVLGCGIRRDLPMAYQLHDIDQAAIVGPVVKKTYRPTTGEELIPVLRAACELARSGAPGPVFVEIPANLYLFRHDVDESAEAGEETRVSESAAGGGGVEGPGMDPELADRAAALLGTSRRPLLYVGAGAASAREEVLALAEVLEAPVTSTFQGKGVFPESHPLFLWPGFGAAAPRFVRDVVSSCDATLAVGCRFGEVATGSYGLEPPGRLIHVDVDPEVLGRNFPVALAIPADVRSFLLPLLECLPDPRGPDTELRERIRRGHEEVWNGWLKDMGGEGVTPAHLLRLLQRHLGRETVYATDSGNGTFLAAECLRLETPGKFLAPVDFSCMGYAVPAALGAKLARPEVPVVALAGDGAFLMTGLELLTGAREGLGAMILVLRDGELAQIAQLQGVALNRKVSSSVAAYDLASMAKGLGLPFLSIDSDDGIEPILMEADAALAEGMPVLVDVAIDYSRKTYFTRGVVKTNLLRLPMKDRLRFAGRALARRLSG